MKMVSFCATLLVAIFLFPNAHASYDAWWTLCNSCEQAIDFRTTAVNGTGGDGIVFVSNPDTLETRKFDRFSTYEDFGNGVIRMIHVSSATLSASEEDVLQGALENGNTVWIAIGRNDLSLPSASSSIDDLSDGMLYPALLSGLRQNLILRNFFPSASGVGAALGVKLGPIQVGGSGGGGGIRSHTLTARINYPDGSYVQVDIKPDQSFDVVVVTDAEGNMLPVIGPDSANQAFVDPSRLGDRQYLFGSDALGALQDFLDWVATTNGGAGLDCSHSNTPNGIRVHCVRLP